MKTIEILGSGCPKCNALTANVQAAAKALGIECNIVKVTDPKQIAQRGVMLTPALAIDGQIKLSGHVADVQEISALLH